MGYLTLKYLHILFATLSITGFAARGLLALRGGSPLLQRPWLRRLPHINDTLLFGAGLWLARMLRQMPFVDVWITVKLGSVLLYIILGFVALRPKFPAWLRLASGSAALLAAAYITHVALTKNIIW
jgi:uncharacterized membrane protein SirB2